MKAISVTLHVKTRKIVDNVPVVDALNQPVFLDSTTTVNGVLVGQPTTEDLTNSLTLYGKRIQYVLGIPKGDTHIWTDTEVEFFGRKYRTFGDTVMGIEENVPTRWHKKVWVELCE